MLPNVDTRPDAHVLSDLSAALCLQGALHEGASVQLQSFGRLGYTLQGTGQLQAWANRHGANVHKLHVPAWAPHDCLLDLLAAMPMLRTLCVDNRLESAMSDVDVHMLCNKYPGATLYPGCGCEVAWVNPEAVHAVHRLAQAFVSRIGRILFWHWPATHRHAVAAHLPQAPVFSDGAAQAGAPADVGSWDGAPAPNSAAFDAWQRPCSRLHRCT